MNWRIALIGTAKKDVVLTNAAIDNFFIVIIVIYSLKKIESLDFNQIVYWTPSSTNQNSNTVRLAVVTHEIPLY